MKKIAIAAALPFALTLAACGDNEVDGTDTTSMEADPVAPMNDGTSDPALTTDPMDGTMPAQEPMTDDMTTDPTMDDPTMTEPAPPPQP